MKQLLLILIISAGLCLQLSLASTLSAAETVQVKELNFVFLHGGGGTGCDLQLLVDHLLERIPAYIVPYERINPGIKVQVNILKRCYPNNVDIATWSLNISDSINKHFSNKENLILIGHSMGGKAALHAVAKNIGGLADKVVLVVTINTPVKSLDKYYITGGGTLYEYYRAAQIIFRDAGLINSVTHYDSSEDGAWVSQNKHWLAFISSENAPLSYQFDIGGFDLYPRNMDDGAIPISAQYVEGVDVIYYGEYGHSDFKVIPQVASFIAEKILRYIFGIPLEYSVLVKSGVFEHKADWMLGTDYWYDLFGEVLISSGKLWHMNESYTKWKEWEDVVGGFLPNDERSRYEIKRVRSSVLFTTIKEVRWLNPNDTEDFRLYFKTRAAPRNYLQVDWNIYGRGLLPEGTQRSHYEVEITTGTALTRITDASWLTTDLRDLRLQVWSQAESPLQWFKAQWRVYALESRHRDIISKIPVKSLSQTVAGKY